MLKNKRTVSTNSFVMTIAVNVDNTKLSDAEFRTFIRNSLPVVKYTNAILTSKSTQAEIL